MVDAVVVHILRRLLEEVPVAMEGAGICGDGGAFFSTSSYDGPNSFFGVGGLYALG